MRKRNHPRNSSVILDTSEPNPIQWLYILLTVICVAFLAVGFFFAARQHFSAMDLGIKNSKLRKQLDDLESEQRHLMLSREVVRSPGEIKRIAKNQGFHEVEDGFVAVQTSINQNNTKQLVTRTVMTATSVKGAEQKTVKAFFPAVAAKPSTVQNPIKRESSAKDVKASSEYAFIAKKH